MAVLSVKNQLTILVLVNLFIYQCHSDVYIGDIGDVAENIDEAIQNRSDIKDIEPERTLAHLNDTTDKETEPTTVEPSEDEYYNRNLDSTEMETDRRRTTIQYVTESTSYIIVDNAVYSKTEDIDNHSANNVIQSEYPTPEATSPGESFEEAATQIESAESQESTGQRSPKTEADSKEQPEKRTLDKPREIAALNKSCTLKSWLEDSWLRPPAGILVPLRPLALTRALAVWNELIEEKLNVTDIVIIGYDSNGISWRSRHNLQPSTAGSGERTIAEALSKLLLKYQGVHTDNMNDGTMRALASAAKLVPYDSALFIITDKGAGDPQRLPLALRALIEKRLKVYTIWTGPNHLSADSALALQDLRNLSLHTEGEVLPYALQISEEESSNLALEAELQEWEPLEKPGPRQARIQNYPDLNSFDTLLVRRGGAEAISLVVPIENGVTALRIYIEGAVEHAVLYPPNNEPQIDLYNQSSIQRFSPSSITINASPRDVYLVFPGAYDSLAVLPVKPSDEDTSRMVGMWHLSIRCETCDYRIQVSARAQIHLRVEVQPQEMLKLHVTGPVASVRESVMVDEFGKELAKLPFSYQPTDGIHETAGPMADLIADIPTPSVSSTPAYVKILGRDVKGQPFVRIQGPINPHLEVRMSRSAVAFPDTYNTLELSEEYPYSNRLQYNDSNILPNGRAGSQTLNQAGNILTAVQIGLSSRLYGAPGDRLQLHFEVTNNREQSVPFTFGAVGELRFLTGIDPSSQTVASRQTVNVIVSLLITSTAQPGARDLITFTAYALSGQEQVSISAYVYVTNPGETIRDTSAPDVRHNFQGTCWGNLGDSCGEHTWSANIIARDSVGGLLRMSSTPAGLTYDSNFISGTREEVQATYRASCCAPRVVINAVDALGNVNSYVIDISNYITGAGIAAIVLAVLLLIVLICLIIFCIYWCVKRRKESRELPSYATSSRHVS